MATTRAASAQADVGHTETCGTRRGRCFLSLKLKGIIFTQKINLTAVTVSLKFCLTKPFTSRSTQADKNYMIHPKTLLCQAEMLLHHVGEMFRLAFSRCYYSRICLFVLFLEASFSLPIVAGKGLLVRKCHKWLAPLPSSP